MQGLFNRNDLLDIFNSATFAIRHYVHGYWPGRNIHRISSPVNRLFFPIDNPNGGKNFIDDGKQIHALESGRLYFVPAFLPVQFSLDEQLYFLSIHTTLDIFPSVELFSSCPYMLNLPCPEEAKELLELFDHCQETSYFDALKIGSLTLAVMVKILENYNIEDFSSPLALKRFAHLSDYLIQNGNAQTSVTELADLCNLSRENFSRKFTEITGLTPKKLIDRFVIKRCIHLLEQGCSFKEISYRLKFSDEFVFSRYFKRVTGESPRDWRKNHSQKTDLV